MVKAFFDSSRDMNSAHLPLIAPWSLRVGVGAWSMARCSALSPFVMLHSVWGLMRLSGLTLCQMTELSLCSLTSTWALFKKKNKQFSLPTGFSWFSQHSCESAFQLSFKPLTLGCRGYFQPLISPGWETIWSKTDTWRGLKMAAWLQEAPFMKNCVADRGQVFLWFFRSANTRAQIPTDGADKSRFKDSAVFQPGSRHYASMGDASKQTNYT